jgi:hypothetical protein
MMSAVIKGRCSRLRLSMFLAVVLLGAGCRSSLLWPFGRESADSPHEPLEGSVMDSLMPAAAASRSVAGRSVHVVHLAFDVLRVDMPVDSVRHSRKIWNHVDGMRIDSQAAGLMARNGLRAGAASPESWPAIQTILESAGGELSNEQLITQRNLPLSVTVSSIDEEETIFSYGRDNRLAGKTFPAGEKALKLDYAFHPELGGCTEIQLGFEVRHDRGKLTWKREGDVIRQVQAYEHHVFTDLGVLLTLNPGESLVIGPSEEAEKEYLVGSRFFMHRRSGRLHETLYCVTPRPYRTDVPGRTSP